MARIFLSYTADDKPVVRPVAKHIWNAGHTYWLDEAELRPGESLIIKLGQALKHSEYIAVSHGLS
jgi:hypothetical protein